MEIAFSGQKCYLSYWVSCSYCKSFTKLEAIINIAYDANIIDHYVSYIGWTIVCQYIFILHFGQTSVKLIYENTW